MIKIGAVIEKGLKERRISALKLAKTAGVSPAMVCQILKGTRHPSHETLIKLAIALREDPESWVDKFLIQPVEERARPAIEGRLKEVEPPEVWELLQRCNEISERLDSLEEESRRTRTSTGEPVRSYIWHFLEEARDLQCSVKSLISRGKIEAGRGVFDFIDRLESFVYRLERWAREIPGFDAKYLGRRGKVNDDAAKLQRQIDQLHSKYQKWQRVSGSSPIKPTKSRKGYEKEVK